MGEVVRLHEKKGSSHLQGQARCLQCEKEWEAFSPVGRKWLECPFSGAFKGMFLFPAEREELAAWTCDCGNRFFIVTANGVYCPVCGLWQKGWE